ncbi:MAG: PDZ domain-containing protein [Akkermansiaceae bacterium]|jgi:serine protease Do
MKLITLLLLCSFPVVANTLPSEKRKNGPLIQKALSPVQVYLQESSAVFYDNKTYKNFVYGTVVSPNGLVLTKASELEDVEDYIIRIGKKKYRSFKVVATDSVWDLALVKVEAEGLLPVDLTGNSEIAHGTWVVSNGASERMFRRPRPGIISANKREIPGGSPAVLGVQFQFKDNKIKVNAITEDSGAERAGIKKGDILVRVDGKEILDDKSFIEYLRVKVPGDLIKLGVLRGSRELELEVELMARHKLFGGPQNRNDQMSGEFSERRTSFPRVLQHETMLSARSVGGPLFTFEGRFLGMNIAAANRVESFTIPVEDLCKALDQLKISAGIQ